MLNMFNDESLARASFLKWKIRIDGQAMNDGIPNSLRHPLRDEICASFQSLQLPKAVHKTV